jgi:hypothetical protein
LFLFFVQDIAHTEGAYKCSRRSQCPGLLSLAGFEVTLIGRIWVTPEGDSKPSLRSAVLQRHMTLLVSESKRQELVFQKPLSKNKLAPRSGT